MEDDTTQLKMNIPPPKGLVLSSVQNGAPRPTPIPVPCNNYINLSQEYEDEDPRYITQETKPEAHLTTDIGEPRVDNKYKMLEESLRAIKGFNVFGVNALEMCLVPDVVIPPKFKAPQFERYKSVSYPMSHI